MNGRSVGSTLSALVKCLHLCTVSAVRPLLLFNILAACQVLLWLFSSDCDR